MVSNLYVCTPNGVQVFDDEGEPFLMVHPTPSPSPFRWCRRRTLALAPALSDGADAAPYP